MSDKKFKAEAVYSTPEYDSEDFYFDHYESFEDAYEDASEYAFSTIGFPLEDWKEVELDEHNRLYFFYPNENDRTIKLKVTISEKS